LSDINQLKIVCYSIVVTRKNINPYSAFLSNKKGAPSTPDSIIKHDSIFGDFFYSFLAFLPSKRGEKSGAEE
jgi:hypothetical protein